MMHYGVADEDNLGNFRLAAAGQARDELAEEYAKQVVRSLPWSAARILLMTSEPKRGLGIELGLDAENVAGGQVEDLRGNGRGAEIDCDAEAALSGADEAASSVRTSMRHWQHSRTRGIWARA